MQRSAHRLEGQREVESGSYRTIIKDADSASVRVNDGFRDIQSQTNTGILAARCITHTVETLKDVVKLLRRDANTFIFYRDPVAFFSALQAHYDLPTVRRILDGIVQHIADDLGNAFPIRDNRALRRLNIEQDGMLLGTRLGGMHTICQ